MTTKRTRTGSAQSPSPAAKTGPRNPRTGTPRTREPRAREPSPREPNPREPRPRDIPDFDPVRTRVRHDGWTPDRQVEFIEALAECGCVDAACRRVGMASSSAYTLRRRIDAESFRQAWDFALDYAIRRLSDAAFSRAINGVATPIFFQGEQIGERRRYDERLTMFMLRYRDPVRYGAWLDTVTVKRGDDDAAIALAVMVNRVARDGVARELGKAPRRHTPLSAFRHVSPADLEAEEARAAERRADAEEAREAARIEARFQASLDKIGPDPDAPPAPERAPEIRAPRKNEPHGASRKRPNQAPKKRAAAGAKTPKQGGTYPELCPLPRPTGDSGASPATDPPADPPYYPDAATIEIDRRLAWAHFGITDIPATGYPTPPYAGHAEEDFDP